MIPAIAALQGQDASVRALFAAGEPGVWYDPSDLSTLFTDAAGTTPVTAVETAVGLILDKSKGGVGTNGAYRYNLLTYTEQFDNAAWTKTNSTVTANSATAPNGTTTAYTLTDNATSGYHAVQQGLSTGSAIAYTGSAYIKAGTSDYAWFEVRGQSGNSWYTINVKLTDGTVTSTSSYGSPAASYTVTRDATTGWCRVTITSTNNAAGSSYPILYIGVSNSASPTFTSGMVQYSGSGSSVYIWGAQLVSGSSALAYQRITSDWPSTMAGNHATQSTSASRPVLSARYNLLTATEDFSSASWTKGRSAITVNATTDPLGGSAADTMLETATTGTHYCFQSYATAATQYTLTVYVKAAGRNWIYLDFSSTSEAGVFFDISTGSKGNTVGTVDASSVTDAGNGWYRCSITRTVAASTYYSQIFIATANGTTTPSYAGDATKGIYIWGADLRVSNDGTGLPAYQRVNTSTDYDTVGFPAYLRFDGVDDFLSAGDVLDLGTQSLTAFAATKISGANGSIFTKSLAGPATGRYAFGRFSSSLQLWYAYNTGAEYVVSVADSTETPRVLTGLIDRDAGYNTIRANGSQIATANVNIYTTNFNTSYRFLIGAYNNSSDTGVVALLNGRIYGLIVRGSFTTDTLIARAETYLNTKSKAY